MSTPNPIVNPSTQEPVVLNRQKGARWAASGVTLLLCLVQMSPGAAQESSPAASTAAAQVPSWGEITEITLDDAWRMAAEGNPDLAIARSRLAQASLIKRRVAAGLQPFINVGANYTHNSVESTLSLGPLITSYTDYQLYANGLAPSPLPEDCADPNDQACAGLVALNQVLSDPIVIQPLDSVGWQASAVWQVGNARAIPQARMAKAAVDAATQGTEWAERELMFGVAQAYYGIFGLQKLVEISEGQVASRRRHLELAQARLDAGQVAPMEVTRAQVEVKRAERQLADAREGLHGGAAELAVLLGVSDVELRVAAPQHPLSSPPTTDAAVDAALSSRPDIRAARRQVDVANAQLSDARLSLLPTVALQASYRWSNAAGFTGENGVWAAGASANLAVWDGGLRLADAAEAKQKIVQAEAALKKLEMGVRKDIELAGSKLDQSRLNLQTTDQELALARSTYDQVLNLYEAGMTTALELRDAELLVTSSEVSQLRAAMNVDLAELALERAVGTFDPAGP